MVDKYGTGQDPYCYPATRVLRNRLGLTSDAALNRAERSLSEIAASEIEFALPPYDLAALHESIGNCLRMFTTGLASSERWISPKAILTSASSSA